MNISQFFGIQYPIIQGGMAQIATGAFAAAVSNAGGLGLIATGGFSAEQLREEIQTARRLTDKPFGVNVLMLHPQIDAIAAIVAELCPAVVTTGAGNPGKYVESWKASGVRVLPVVPSCSLAKRMENAGADGVIAEGTESGGHVGEMTTMALVPQVCGTVKIPVIAAGGIASGRQLLAAFALGAAGAQIGTALLAAEECPIHENYKQALLTAKDTDTVVTGRNGGVPVRILKNRMAREYLRLEKEGADKETLEQFTLGSLRKAVSDGDTANGSLMAGQVAGQLREIRPVRVILEELMSEMEEAKRQITDDK